jgi:hypothetical protein
VSCGGKVAAWVDILLLLVLVLLRIFLIILVLFLVLPSPIAKRVKQWLSSKSKRRIRSRKRIRSRRRSRKCWSAAVLHHDGA